MSGNGVSSGSLSAPNATAAECWQVRQTGQTPVKPLAFIAAMVGAWIGVFAGMGATEVSRAGNEPALTDDFRNLLTECLPSRRTNATLEPIYNLSD
jgi:hypothetical protein